MEARKVQLKVYLESPREVDVDPIVPVFHDWISKKALGELLIDVTDYAHVKGGPALLLVGHGSDYAVDFGEGRPGLLYSRKRDAPAGAVECVLDAFRRAFGACRKLEEEKSLPVPLRFRTDELLFRVNDRLLAPNTKENVAAVEPVLREALAKVYAGADITLESEGSPRELLTLRVKAPGAPRVDGLLARLL